MNEPYPCPIRIDPEAFYEDGALRLLLNVPSATLARARREGGLRHRRCGHRILYQGEWVRAWLQREQPRAVAERVRS